MGANQSAPGSEARGGGAGSGNGADVKTCYYDLLGLERQATDEEIKKAYRRKALELHPDRNYGDVEKTTRLFAEIQAAYEVLSDPQERAWYDSHRDAILRHDAEGTGDHFEHNVRVTTAEDIMKMFSTFHGRMDFSDSSTGFFTVLRGAFDTLADEENVACDWEGAEPIDYPSFGHADDSYEDVVRPFYAAWGGFATKKTFAWKDAYHYSEAPDRRVRRRMEKENKRFREEGIREFNDAVRSLVAFVRKRDPRYVPNTQSEADRQKVIREAAAAQAARSRAANQAKLQGHVEPEWAKSQGPDELEGSIDEEEESEEEHFECVACGKTFKSEKQFEAHERSKKHIKMVQQLKRKMQKEDRAMKNSQAQDGAPVASESLDDSEMDLEHSELEDEEALFEDPSLSAPENSHAKEREQKEGSDELTNEADAEEQLTTSEQVKAESESSDPEESDDEYAPRETVESRILGKEKDVLASGDDANPSREGHAEAENLVENFGETSIAGGIDSAGPRRAGKAREKRERKAAQQQQQQQQQQMGATHKCAACDEQFSSKTKLFNHIKELGHAQPMPKAAKGQKGRKQ